MVRAEGSFYWDPSGRRIIDGNSGLQNVNIGHGRPEMAEVAARQIRTLDYFPVYNGTHPAVEELAETLSGLLPDFDRFIFQNSGSEANEAALKLLREYWLLRDQPQRTVVLSRLNSFHGVTLGALASTGRGKAALRQPFEPFLMESVTLSDPTVLPGEDEAAATDRLRRELEETLERVGPERVMALFAEPVQQHRVPVPPKGYFAALHAVCSAHDVPLVADEVITGFGRTGAWFGMESWGATPDLAILGKGLASGYAPISAVAVGARIAAPFDASPDRLFHHLSTTAGHPTACALAVENIRIIEREGLVDRSLQAGEQLRGLLGEAFAGWPDVAAVSGVGMLNSVVFSDRELSLDLASSARLRALCLELGAYIRVDGQLWFIPPLNTDAPTLERLVTIAVEAANAWIAEQRP
jgi:adenosylmethionine-8-amino-7-oxononanoate aminotransferase